MRSANTPRSLCENRQFAIEVHGLAVALFPKGTEPKTEFEEVAFPTAGSMFDQKVAGRLKSDDIKLGSAASTGRSEACLARQVWAGGPRAEGDIGK